MKLLTTATIALALAVTAQAASASCDAGEMVIKFSHVTNTDKQRTQVQAEGKQSSIKLSGSKSKETWWETESRVCGVPDGVSYGVDRYRAKRIKALGNSIVPQIARQIGLAIMEAENDN